MSVESHPILGKQNYYKKKKKNLNLTSLPHDYLRQYCVYKSGDPAAVPSCFEYLTSLCSPRQIWRFFPSCWYKFS